MSANVLLLGRTGMVLENVEESLGVRNSTLFSGTSLVDVRRVFDEHEIDTVIMGAGIDLPTRLEIVEYIFTTSDSTTVHMKDRASGPVGMFPFVDGILSGLYTNGDKRTVWGK